MKYNLMLDKEGWTPISELLIALSSHHHEQQRHSNRWLCHIEKQNLEEMIERSDKVRFEIKDDKIRALYGHSCSSFIPFTKIQKIASKPPVGRVMAWVVESLNPEKREHAENQIYDLFQNHYKKEPSSIDIFCSIYYRKCKERGLFGDLVEHYRKVAGAPILLLGRPGFSRHLMMVPIRNMKRDINFWTLWNDSVMELDKDTRLRMFHHLKLEIEKKAEELCHAFGAFERLRYQTKNNPEYVTIEGQCNNCNLYTQATFWLNEYLHEVFKAYPNEVIVGKQCPVCKNNDSLEFSIIL